MKITSTMILTIFACIWISACSTNAKYTETTLIKDIDEHISTPFEHKSVSSKNCYEKVGQRNIAVFFDGTANNPSSETNLFKLKSMVAMQPMVGECPQNYVLYVKGIGSQGNWFKKLLEGMTGWGIGEDVRQAYQYVSTYYRGEQDNIYIFGFSRGAAAARILASFLDTAGISKKMLSEESIDHLYDIYKGNESIDSRKKLALDFIGPENKIIPEVAFMGLFDTVAALGFTHFGEDKAELNSHYSDTLCSVKRAAHAVSIDDNRSSDFTPALINKKQIRYCEELKPNLNFVDQVWFSGAHSDIGGGYLDTDLSGVTLNWMIGRVIFADEELGKELGSGHVPLIKNVTTTYEDPLGLSHDAEEDSWYSRNQNRDWPNILNKTNNRSENQKYLETGFEAPQIHKSVEFRLAHKPRKEGSRDFDWIAKPKSNKYTSNYSSCFVKQVTDKGVLLTLKKCPVLQPGEACPTVWGAKPADCPE